MELISENEIKQSKMKALNTKSIPLNEILKISKQTVETQKRRNERPDVWFSFVDVCQFGCRF